MNKLVLRSMVSTLLLLVLLSVPSIASADAVLWTLTGTPSSSCPTGCVTFSDGGTASGSFDYNFATNTFSNINVTTTLGSVLGGATYTTLSTGPFMITSTTLWLGANGADLSGTNLLALLFDNPLMNSGGTMTVDLTTGLDFGGGEGSCVDSTCETSSEGRFITGGGATSTVAVTTPEPTALSLLGVALAALLAGVAMRKASQA